MTEISNELAVWVSGLEADHLPPHVLEKAKLCLADSIACLVGGADLTPSKLLSKVLSRSSQGAIAVPGLPVRLGLFDAAYYGAQTANLLDFDDDFVGHPGATVSPVALAVGQSRGASGTELLTSIVAGYEVSLRIGEAIMPTYSRTEIVHGYSCWQTFGAAVTAAKLLDLNETAIVHALGLAGAQAPVPNIRKFIDGNQARGWLKNGYGIAGQVGALSAEMAAEGYLGNPDIFGGKDGFWVMAGSDRFRAELATKDLGTDWKIDSVMFKEYPCCYWLQTTVDAASELSDVVESGDIAAVTIYTFNELVLRCAGPYPTSIFEAQFHAPYLVALQLLGRSPARGLNERDLSDPLVRNLAQKVVLRHDSSMDLAFEENERYPVRAEADRHDGTTAVVALELPRAATEPGKAEKVVEQKFLAVMEPKFGLSHATEAWDMIQKSESLDVNDLVRLFIDAEVASARP